MSIDPDLPDNENKRRVLRDLRKAITAARAVNSPPDDINKMVRLYNAELAALEGNV